MLSPDVPMNYFSGASEKKDTSACASKQRRPCPGRGRGTGGGQGGSVSLLRRFMNAFMLFGLWYIFLIYRYFRYGIPSQDAEPAADPAKPADSGQPPPTTSSTTPPKTT